MNKLAILALSTLSLALVTCDDASKEKLNATVEEAKQHATGLQEESENRTQQLTDSANDAWQETKEQAQSSVAELVPEQIQQAKDKMAAVGDLTVSDLLGMGDTENEQDAAQPQEEDEN